MSDWVCTEWTSLLCMIFYIAKDKYRGAITLEDVEKMENNVEMQFHKDCSRNDFNFALLGAFSV